MTNYFNRIGSCTVRARLAALALLLSVFGSAQAAITCNINQPAALNFAYQSGTTISGLNSRPNNTVQNAVVATCYRQFASDPVSAMLTLGSNDGVQPTTNTNQAVFSGNFIKYNLWRNVGCSQPFQDTTGTRISASFASTTLSPVTVIFDYWGCIPGQAVASFPAGVYTDSVMLTLRNGAVTLATSAIAVSINAPAKCSISNGPGNITFSYTAFGPANFQFTGFSADCTNLLQYTMTVDRVSGVVGGLRYELGLSDTVGSAGNLGPATLSRVGNSSGSRGHVINGAMPSNQAGDRSAIAPQPHTLTITY